jgi:murein DD-endopeptidase MepM/ murein hydrolase activator NlpD
MIGMKNNTSKNKAAGLLRDVVIAVVVAVVFVSASHFYHSDSQTGDERSLVPERLPKTMVYGFDADSITYEQDLMKPNQFLGDILQQGGVDYADIIEMEEKAKYVFDVRGIRSGKPYTMIFDSCHESCLAFIYEPSPFYYVNYNFEDSVFVEKVDRDYEVCQETAAGRIETSLWNAMMDQNLSPSVIDLMEDALASAVDFHHTQVGDEFKLIYERKYIGGKPVSLGKVLGAYWRNAQGETYSIYYDSDKYEGYFDEEGRPTKSTFLRAPVKFSRISSRYNLRRFHPIKKRRIPHLGTDYAAAYGTPIRATADGVVIARSYTKNNGNYIKLKHDKTYQTQYLHMQRFAKGVRPGVKVKQGQTIGYVGSTGLATGPHVCYRFWKNGKQIDPLRENFPPADPMPAEALPEFYETRDRLKTRLDAIEMPPSTLIAGSMTGSSTS